jgi:aldehyde dehydrogenase (NAD+)
VYSKNNNTIKHVIESTSSRDAAINTCVVHYLQGNLPFGGANNSGIGKAHGFWGFKSFSHERSVLRDRFASTQMLAPPYTNFVKFMVRLALRWFT